MTIAVEVTTTVFQEIVAIIGAVITLVAAG
jgi:hypothetical protein